MIHINTPKIGKEEIEAVTKVLKSGTLTHGLGMGPMVTGFEKAFAEFVKAKHAVAVNSGTAALHLALLAAGIKPGDEVILPSFTFVATAEIVVMAGAKPVFVDIDPETFNISPKKIVKAVTKKTKAVIPVDLYGMPADMQPIREMADKKSLAVIEDSCQAHGASYKRKPIGAFADAACWSFFASKNMTTGEGGMVTTNNGELAENMRVIRSHGEKEKYKSTMLGHNYRMPEIEAAIGHEQLKKLPTFLARRRRNAKKLTEILRKTRKLQLPSEPEGYRHSWYLYTIRVKGVSAKERDKIAEELRGQGIGVGVYYVNPIHLMPYYSKFGKYKLPETERAAKQVLSLPVHPGVSDKQIDFIGKTVLHVLR